MRIISLGIRNFRSFGPRKNNLIKFDSGINLIVGENNVGKTTIFKAIEKIKAAKKFEPNDYHGGNSNRS